MAEDIEARLTAARALQAATSETVPLISTYPGDLSTVLRQDRPAVEDRVHATPMGDVEFTGLSRPVPIVEITALR